MRVTISNRSKSETRIPKIYIQPGESNISMKASKPSHWASRYKLGIELINSRKLLKSDLKSNSSSVIPKTINLSKKKVLIEIPKTKYLQKRPKKIFQSFQLSPEASWIKIPFKKMHLDLKGHTLSFTENSFQNFSLKLAGNNPNYILK